MSPSKIAAFLLMALTLTGFSGLRLAADFRAGEARVEVDGTVDDDVYAAGEEVVVSGEVTGDVLAGARSIRLEGSTGGSFFGAAETIDIGGEVGNSARIGAREVTVTGTITGDLLAGAQSVIVAEEGSIGRDLVAGSQTLEIAGEVGGNVLGGNQSVTISGTVRGDVKVETDSVTLTDGALIEGDLVYTSRTEAEIDSGAEVEGEIERRTPAAVDEGSAVSDIILSFVRSVGGALVLGLLVLWLLPGLLPALGGTIRKSAPLSLGVGVLGALVIPLVAIFLLITTLLLGAGVSVPLLLITVAGFLLVLAKVMVGYTLGGWILNRTDRDLDLPFAKAALALLLGVVILSALSLVPYLGGLVSFVVAMVALGAGIVALARWRKKPGAEATPPEPAATTGA